MANYNLVINSKFKPFSFKELVEPYLMYKQEYDTQQAALGELQAKASVWENMANEQTDPLAYARYKTYADNLRSQSDALATRGLNPSSKQALMNLRADYSARITPIEQAFTARQKQAEQQQQALLQDDSLLFDRDAATTSLDDYMANPQLQYDVKSGNKLTARVAAAAQNLAKEFRDNPDKMIPLVGGDYYEYIKKRGFSSEAILAAIADNENASPVLKNLVEDAVGSTGIAGWNNQKALDAAYSYARQGLWNAIGQDEAQLVQNWRAQENLQHSHAMARQAAAQAFQAREAEKNRQFQREQNQPIPMLGDDGKPNGDYYNPKTGTISDKDGNLKTDASGNPLVIKTNNGKDTTPASKTDANGKPTSLAFREVTDNNSMKKLGFTPLFTMQKHHKVGGKVEWQTPAEGEDVTRVWNDFNTNTRLISDSGDAVYDVPKSRQSGMTMSYVTDDQYGSLPSEVKTQIEQELKNKGYQDGTPFEVLRVNGMGSRKDDYDYIIYMDNDYIH